MAWIIKPHESFGPLMLGMSPDAIKDILGPSMKRKVLSASKFCEIYVLEAPRLIFDHERLVEIGINPRQANLFTSASKYSRMIPTLFEEVIVGRW